MFCVPVQLKRAICVFVSVFLPGVLGMTDWGVTYGSRVVCALKGSSVVMLCNYTYPSTYEVSQTFWINKWPNSPPLDLMLDQKYSQRVKYLGDKQHNCTFQIGNLYTDDAGSYWFRFITHNKDDKWTGNPGVSLSVTGLQATVQPTTVREGQNVTVTCVTNCSLSDNAAFVWHQNENLLNTPNPNSGVLYLQSVTSAHSGNYTCAVKGKEGLPSNAIFLNVTYAPRNTSVTVSPSGDILEGTVVTLSCSSDANPPVSGYTWFKKNGAEVSQMVSGQNLIISNITSKDSGLYCCSGQNTYGTNNSSEVALDVQYAPKNVSLSVSPPGNITEGTAVSLTCSSRANPAAENYTWFMNGNNIVKTGVGQNYTILSVSSSDSGLYYCIVSNSHGSGNSTALFLNVLYAPRNTSVTVSPSGDILEGTVVTLSCSSDANPPVSGYTWFKKNGAEVSQMVSGQNLTISNITFEDGGEYFCQAETQQGIQNSTSVSIGIAGSSAFLLIPLVVGCAACSVILFLFAVVCMGWKRFRSSKKTSTDEEVSKSPVYANVSAGAIPVATGMTSDKRDKTQLALGQEESKDPSQAASSNDDDLQYAHIQFPIFREATRSPVQTVESTMGIYSIVSVASAPKATKDI